MPHGIKLTNEYARALGPTYDKIPKAVLAAIAVSFGTLGGELLENAESIIMEEWRVLHENGIVPQRPTTRL